MLATVAEEESKVPTTAVCTTRAEPNTKKRKLDECKPVDLTDLPQIAPTYLKSLRRTSTGS